MGIGVNVREPHEEPRYWSQFFPVGKFMELAAKDFVMGETVKALELHIQEMGENTYKTIENQTDCVSYEDVFQSPCLGNYHPLWNDERWPRKLADCFIRAMYNCDEIKEIVKQSYEGFPAKKTLFGLRPADAIENIFRKRTKKLQKSLKKKGREWQDLLRKEEDERKNKLEAAIDKYKKVVSEYKKIESSENVTWGLIECTIDILSANKGYSELVKRVVGNDNENINKYQKKISQWVKPLSEIESYKADRTVGMGEDFEQADLFDINISDSVAAKSTQETMLSSNKERFTGEKDEDNLVTYADSSSRIETVVRDKLLLVDSSILRKVPGKRYRCNECGKEVVIDSWETHRCPKCGKMGCLERKKN